MLEQPRPDPIGGALLAAPVARRATAWLRCAIDGLRPTGAASSAPTTGTMPQPVV